MAAPRDKRTTEEAASSHITARVPGAIDALCLMYTMTKYTKEAMFPHTGTWTLNEFILGDGGATSDNLPPRFSQIQYSWRSSSLGIQEQIWRVLANNARHVAGITGCRAHVRWVTKTRVGLPNKSIRTDKIATIRPQMRARPMYLRGSTASPMPQINTREPIEFGTPSPRCTRGVRSA